MKLYIIMILVASDRYCTSSFSHDSRPARHRQLDVQTISSHPLRLSATTQTETKPPSARSTAVFSMMNSLSNKNPFFAIRQLENDPDFLRLESRDRAFARLLLSTAERRQGQIDKVIAAFMNKSNEGQKKKAVSRLCQATLRIGVAQLLFLDVAKHAAVQETVEVLRMHKKIKVSKPQISFVNAVLRNVDRRGRIELETNTSLFDNVEPWLAEKWIRTYGEDTTTKILRASMAQSPIFVSVNHEPASDEESRIANIQRVRDYFSMPNNTATILPHGSIEIPRELHGGAVSKWPGYSEGEWWVQDPSASLPAIALHNSLCKHSTRNKEDMHIVDLCSAPGGKTAQLCSLGFGKVTAVEVSRRRTKALHENMKRLGMSEVCEIVVADGREWIPSTANNEVDGVLADVPCSATGVGSRRPDVLRKSASMLDELSKLQRELAAHAADEILQPGGIMIYATCSLLQEESEAQVEWLLSRTEGAVMETVPIVAGEIPGFDEAIDDNGWLRVIPGVLPGSLAFCDGFFVARLRRTR
eukprot:scaffold6032_cov100-Cylindrotheca_fusiformis.AAC.4